MLKRRPAVWAACFAVLGTGFGAWLAFHVPPGLPYDEPAHWSTVLYYAREHRMPVLGDPGVSYEAQMGPVYYALAGLLVSLVGSSQETHAFFTLRLAGVLLIPLLTFLTYRLAQAVHRDPWVAVGAAALIAVNPLMTLIGSSIQNDYLNFVLIAAAVLLAIRVVREPDSALLLHVGLGALIGLATLTKVVAAAVLPALLFVYVVQHASLRRRALWTGAAALGFVVVTGWWFARNLTLYGDLTGGRGIARLGISFPPLRIQSLGDVASWMSSIVGYLYAPVEYYRNVLKAPGPFRVGTVLVLVLTLGVVGAFTARHLRGARRSRGRHADPGRVLLVSVPLVTLGAWLGYDIVVWNVPVRLAFHAASMAAVLLAVATRGRLGGLARGANLGILLAMDAWLVLAVAGVSVPALNPLS